MFTRLLNAVFNTVEEVYKVGKNAVMGITQAAVDTITDIAVGVGEVAKTSKTRQRERDTQRKDTTHAHEDK